MKESAKHQLDLVEARPGCVGAGAARVWVVELPVPRPILWPNNRAHWRAFARAKKLARRIGRLEGIRAMNGETPPRIKRARSQAAYFFKDRRGLKADGDNALAALKAYIDGVADSGLLDNDRGLTHEPVTIDVDRERPRVEITITEIVEAALRKDIAP